ncbi:hypothetical protein GYMLUDRAFT_41944 [Collybiopsis luxurians FD-317 M1]|uniref:Uncharacterized protein n=1 Tax=Collybiopsis luxurians FD-317 M1 TaxID=944289 RepID=A0A0D0BFB6_9AGAR|nr:hypothetical protein GYMLUDRAFT_41944 [Collybiopsis luxurians FD-317 M1]
MNSATGRNASIGQKRPNISTKKKIITQKRPGHASSAQPIYRQPSANGQRGFILRSRRIDIRGGGQDPSRWKHDFQDPVQDRTTKGASSSNEGLVNQMGRLGLHGNLASEIYKAHARLDQASKDVDSRMKDAAEHDARARVLRERAKKQQPPLATSTEPSSSEPTPIGRKSTKEILEFEAVWGDYRKRLWAREIPPGKPAPFTISSSTLDGLVRVFKQREDAERRRRQEEGARARELVARKEEEAAREREAKARAHIEKLKRKRMEEERQKKETERRKVEERRRREQEEEIRKVSGIRWQKK